MENNGGGGGGVEMGGRWESWGLGWGRGKRQRIVLE